MRITGPEAVKGSLGGPRQPKAMYINSYHILSGGEMMPSAYSIPKVYEDNIRAVVEAGYYSNRSEVVRDALRVLFETKGHLRQAAAIQLYQDEEVTLSKAAELAGMNVLELKEILADRGIPIRTPGGDAQELDEQMDDLEETS